MGTLVGAPDVVGCIHVCVCLLTCFFVCLFMSGHVSLRASCFWGCVVALGEDGVGSVSCLHVFFHLPDSCVNVCLCALQLRLCAGHGPKGPQRSECCCQGRGGSTPGKDCHASNSSGDKGSNILNCLKRKNYLMDSPLTPRISGMILFQSITGRITSAV